MNTVDVRDDGPVRVVTLSRPHVRNAIDLELRVELAEVIEGSMAEAGVRALVVTGAGGFFSAGGDISSMRRQAPELTRVRVEAVQRVTRAIWTGDKPVVAAVEGPAMGAGLALALACDRVVAARDAVLGAAFAGIGLAGDMGIFASLPARIGPAAAKQLLMLPRRIPAPEAAALGLVDVLVDPGTALTAAITDAQALAAGPPLALAAVKRMLGAWPRDRLEVLDAEVETQAQLFDTDDFAEGIAAFHDRRPPRFVGS